MESEAYRLRQGVQYMSQNAALQNFRRELRASIGDRARLSKLHAIVTETINNSYGEEKTALVELRREIKDALNCRVPGVS
jgi:hypothetical protein